MQLIPIMAVLHTPMALVRKFNIPLMACRPSHLATARAMQLWGRSLLPIMNWVQSLTFSRIVYI